MGEEGVETLLLIRDVERKFALAACSSEKLRSYLDLSKKIVNQRKDSKDKVYSFHESAVECIAKGKAHKRYEFVCKVSVMTTNHSNWVVGVKALHGRPYDGHTIPTALEQFKKIIGKFTRIPHEYRLTIVLDMDETLVDARSGVLHIRPFAHEILQLLSSSPGVEIVFWTAGREDHARSVATELVKANPILLHNRPHLVFRGNWMGQDDGGYHTKPLTFIANYGGRRDRVLLVDNSEYIARTCGGPAIRVSDYRPSYDGRHEDLRPLGVILQALISAAEPSAGASFSISEFFESTRGRRPPHHHYFTGMDPARSLTYFHPSQRGEPRYFLGGRAPSSPPSTLLPYFRSGRVPTDQTPQCSSGARSMLRADGGSISWPLPSPLLYLHLAQKKRTNEGARGPPLSIFICCR